MNKSYRKMGAAPMRTGQNVPHGVHPMRKPVDTPEFSGMLALVFVHVLLALAMRASSLLATAHALLTIAVGLSFALFSKDTRKVAYVAAYITGAEVLWRMTNAQIYWEGGKYITILILGIALLRIKPWQRAGLPVLYFLLLCFSIPLTISALGWSSAARDAISFNLSGPLALMACALYFSQITVDQDTMQRLAWWIILPILGIAALTIYGTLTAGSIVFTGESNFATSGGFGPSQVSAVLGLGGGLGLMLFLMGKSPSQRGSVLIFAVGLLSLSAMTFSRGGLYNVAVMLALALAHYMRSARGRVITLVVLIVIGLAGGYLIFPRLNSFTGGKLEQRFADLDPTLRDKIALDDLDLWFANPVLGVGPGISQIRLIALFGRNIAAHTEYSRVLAEHGAAGLLALLVLFFLMFRIYIRAPNIEAQIWVVAFLAWPLVEMSHAAMRIVAASFLFGLAMVNWENGESAPEPLKNQAARR